MFEIAVLLLPVAAASGWYLASKSHKKKANTEGLDHAVYFKGLNFLLNEQPDKAIDVFVDLLEVDDETIEVHLALGGLFRQRGEVEKAIRLHQNLIARPELSQELRVDVLNELGMDYMRAGLLDRAENIFLELEKKASHRANAIRQLLSIFQQEKEWRKAVEYGKKLELLMHKTLPPLMSHMHCEIADEHKKNHQVTQSRGAYSQALKVDSKCIRANVGQADLLIEAKDFKKALKYLLVIKKQDPRFISVFVDKILDCFDKLDQPKGKISFLAAMHAEVASDVLAEKYVNELKKQRGEVAAFAFVKDKLKASPSLMYLALYSNLSAEKQAHAHENILMEALAKIYALKFNFQCQHCGFNAKELNWNCPSCKQWGTALPVQGKSVFSSAPELSE
ncbi:MAG: hypothetical protein A6F71_04570 [Cycloclasticus sp. symbiont of Poecilosclerida sp. M]|nr:MAG: hypothetical protein A6F71_04570 [Cycloclasticus sp. symbiont of Poecilosclerida sp. M]